MIDAHAAAHLETTQPRWEISEPVQRSLEHRAPMGGISRRWPVSSFALPPPLPSISLSPASAPYRNKEPPCVPSGDGLQTEPQGEHLERAVLQSQHHLMDPTYSAPFPSQSLLLTRPMPRCTPSAMAVVPPRRRNAVRHTPGEETGNPIHPRDLATTSGFG